MHVLPLAALLFSSEAIQIPSLVQADTLWLIQGGGHGWIKPRRKEAVGDGCIRVADRRVPLHQAYAGVDTLLGPFEVCEDTGKFHGFGLVRHAELMPARKTGLHSVRHEQGIRLHLMGRDIRADSALQGTLVLDYKRTRVDALWRNATLWGGGAIYSGQSLSATKLEFEWESLRFDLLCPAGLEFRTSDFIAGVDDFFSDSRHNLSFWPGQQFRIPQGAKMVRYPASERRRLDDPIWTDLAGKDLSVADTFQVGFASSKRPSLRWGEIGMELDLDSNWLQIDGSHPPGEVILRAPSSGHVVHSGASLQSLWKGGRGSVPGEVEAVDLPGGWRQEAEGLTSIALGGEGRFSGWKPGDIRWKWKKQTFKVQPDVLVCDWWGGQKSLDPSPSLCEDVRFGRPMKCSVAWGKAPSQQHGRLRWVADPPLWDSSTTFSVEGFGSGRLEPWFTWIGMDSIRVRARIQPDSGWRRLFGDSALTLDFPMALETDSGYVVKRISHTRIREFFVACPERYRCLLADSSWIRIEGATVLWMSVWRNGQLALIPAPSPRTSDFQQFASEVDVHRKNADPLAGSRRKQLYWEHAVGFLPARSMVVTKDAIFLDTSSVPTSIRPSAAGMTFTVADVVADTSLLGYDQDESAGDKFRSVVVQGRSRPRDPLKDGFGAETKENVRIVSREFGEHRLVDIEGNGFLQAFVRAWDQHRPVGISPDAVWMLLVDGLALSVESEPEIWRKRLGLDHQGKKALSVLVSPKEASRLQDPPVWREIAQRLVASMHASTNGLDTLLVPDFSTTNPMRRTAFRFRALEVVKPYFDYTGMVTCGIPSVTLQGTPQDWEQLRQRAQALGRLGLSEWTDSLAPLLDEFVAASKGHPDVSFWKGFVRRSSSMGCDPIYHVDGWIGRLFPFEKYEDRIIRRTSLVEPLDLRFTPAGVGSIDFKLAFPDGGGVRNFSVASGLVGVGQDAATRVLWPEMGWAAFQYDDARKSVKPMSSK
jgi:hypothetical protein